MPNQLWQSSENKAQFTPIVNGLHNRRPVYVKFGPIWPEFGRVSCEAGQVWPNIPNSVDPCVDITSQMRPSVASPKAHGAHKSSTRMHGCRRRSSFKGASTTWRTEDFAPRRRLSPYPNRPTLHICGGRAIARHARACASGLIAEARNDGDTRRTKKLVTRSTQASPMQKSGRRGGRNEAGRPSRRGARLTTGLCARRPRPSPTR